MSEVLNSAKMRFDAAMARCEKILLLYEKTEQNDDLLRWCVVLCVSALDMYASDRFMQTFTDHIKKGGLKQYEIKLLEDANVTLEVALDLLREQKRGGRPYGKIRGFVERHFAKASRQSFAKIDELYAYYGFSSIVDNILQKGNRKTLATKIDAMLKRRHRIVHEADYDGKHNLAHLEVKKVRDWMGALKLFVESMEYILDNRFSSSKRRKSMKNKKVPVARGSASSTVKDNLRVKQTDTIVIGSEVASDRQGVGSSLEEEHL